MKTFKERIKYYVIGLGMGVIAVAFLFGKRSCAWLPGNQVKNTIAMAEVIYGDSIKAVMECSNITNGDIYDLLDTGGDVNFGESSTHEDPKKYVFNGDNDLTVKFAMYENYSELIEVNSDCNLSISNYHKETIPLPRDIVSSIIEGSDFTYYPITECQMDFYNLTKSEIEVFHKTADINMEKSISWPKGEGEDVENKKYYLDGKINDIPYSVMYEIGENRTRIKHIIGEIECNCE